MSILILPPEIQNQIAAGEVVERPASVVKECVENSIDAGANHIEIQIEEGGKKLIQITDNGSGMSPEDAEKSLLRHATSKIQSIDDLFSIQSFGFRGEALAAISSVSDFTLITKRDEDNQGIQIISPSPLGRGTKGEGVPANNGTTIRIQNLFSPTPARLQYLKTNETEYRQCLKTIQAFALSHPQISFKLIKDQTITLDLPSSNLETRVQKILKKSGEQLLTINHQPSTAKISGYTSSPGHYVGNKNHQHLFVNNRYIEDHHLAYAIREAYVQSCGIEKHLFPFFVIFIEIDPILVDVNVHPRKTEVKFAEPGEIFSLIKGTVIDELKKLNGQSTSPDSVHHNNQSYQSQPSFSPRGSGAAANFNKSLFSSADSFADRHLDRNTIPSIPENRSESIITKDQSVSKNAPLNVLSQIENKYILAQSDDGLYLFDQHALHERLRFERLFNQAQEKKIETQPLLIPQSVKLSEEDVSIIHEYKSDVRNLGFVIDITSDTTIEISQVPALLKSEDFEVLFQDFSQYFENDQIGENSYEKMLRKMLEYKSCRGSVFFGDHMEKEEMQQLLDEFQSAEWKLLCPHGRPNHVFWSYEDIDKMFHR